MKKIEINCGKCNDKTNWKGELRMFPKGKRNQLVLICLVCGTVIKFAVGDLK